VALLIGCSKGAGVEVGEGTGAGNSIDAEVEVSVILGSAGEIPLDDTTAITFVAGDSVEVGSAFLSILTLPMVVNTPSELEISKATFLFSVSDEKWVSAKFIFPNIFSFVE
jgi:hypothetical protein